MGKKTIRYGVAQGAASDNSLTLLLESERSTQTVNYGIDNGIQFVNNSGQDINFIGSSGLPINFFSSGGVFIYQTGNPGGVGGIYLGFTLTGSVVEYNFNALMIEFAEAAAFGSVAVAIQ